MTTAYMADIAWPQGELALPTAKRLFDVGGDEGGILGLCVNTNWGAGRKALSRRQAEAWLEATHDKPAAFLGAYCPPFDFTGDPVAQAEEALEVHAGLPRLFLGLDVEWYPETGTPRPPADPEQNVDFVRRAAQACEGKCWTIIYANQDNWDRLMGGSFAFAGWPFWGATGDKTPDLSTSDRKPVGPWIPPFTAEQFRLDTVFRQVISDLNFIDMGWVNRLRAPAATPELPPFIAPPEAPAPIRQLSDDQRQALFEGINERSSLLYAATIGKTINYDEAFRQFAAIRALWGQLAA